MISLSLIYKDYIGPKTASLIYIYIYKYFKDVKILGKKVILKVEKFIKIGINIRKNTKKKIKHIILIFKEF